MALRTTAWNKLKSAKRLCDAGQYDDAAYLAGYTAELALKARYCTRKEWPDWPEDKSKLKSLNAPKRLFQHDLEELLTFTGDIQIKTNTMQHIDWDAVAKWDVESRYKPVGTFSRDTVNSRIAETQNLFMELVRWEIVEKLHGIENEQSKIHGPFNFFAFVFDRDVKGWGLWFSTWRWCISATDDLKARVAAFVELLKVKIDGDLFEYIKNVRHFDPNNTILQSFYTAVESCIPGGIQHQMRCITSHNVVVGMPAMPPAYIITCVNWNRDSVLSHGA